MKRWQAWVLLACGVPTPALRRGSAGKRTVVAPTTGSSSGGTQVTVTVTTTNKVANPPNARPTMRQRPAISWLSDDPDVADVLAHIAPEPPSPPTPTRPRRRRSNKPRSWTQDVPGPSWAELLAADLAFPDRTD